MIKKNSIQIGNKTNRTTGAIFRFPTMFCLLISPTLSIASNAEFQDFFFDVCANSTAALTTRCNETDGGLGNLSGDSESSLNPSQTLSTGDSAVYAAQQRGQKIHQRLEDKRESTVGDDARVDIGPFSVLIHAYGGTSESSRVVDVDAERGYELDESGGDLGLDYRVNDNLVMGAWLQWGGSDLTFDRENNGTNFNPINNAGNIETDRLGLTAYLSVGLGDKAYLDFAYGYSNFDVTARRNSIFQESNRVIAQTNSLTVTDTDGQENLFTASLGYPISINSWSITPIIGLTQVNTEIEEYLEQDVLATGLALDVALKDQSVRTGHIGVGFSKVISLESWVFLPQVRLRYQTELSRDVSQADVRFINDAGNNVFQLVGDDFDSDHLNVGIGFSGILQNGWIPFLEYELTTGNDNLERNKLTVGLRIEL